MVQEFYIQRGATPNGAGETPELSFIRGRKWIGWLSWLLPLSEKWPFQTISISFIAQTDSVLINVEYNVWLFLTIIFSPNLLEKEARALSIFLAEKHA